MLTGKKALIVVAVLVLGAGAIAATLGFRKHKEQVDHSRLLALVAAGTEDLRRALIAPPSRDTLAQLDGYVQEVKSASYQPELADAAEYYLVSAREITRRRIDGDRLAREAAASRQALASHMSRAARRDPNWIRGASELQKRVERDHAELERSLKTLEEQLFKLIDAEKRLAPLVNPSILLGDGPREAARVRAKAEAKRVADELDQIRRLGS